MTDPWVEITRIPINTIVIINGASQYFFLIFKKSQISINNSKIVPILENPIHINFTFIIVSSVSFSTLLYPFITETPSNCNGFKGFWISTLKTEITVISNKN